MFVELNPFLICLCIRKGVLDEMVHRNVSLLFLKSNNEYCSGEYSSSKYFLYQLKSSGLDWGTSSLAKVKKIRVMTMEALSSRNC